MDIDQLRSARWVLLPGTLCDGTVFDGFLDALAVPLAQRTPHRLTRPSVEDYRDLFEAEVRAGDVVCGFSLGAIVAAHHADALNHAAALVLFGINPHPDDPAKAAGRLALQADVLAMGGRDALAGRLPLLHGPDPVAARDHILRMAHHTADDIAAQTSLALTRPGALQALAAASIPVVALTGQCDTQANPAFAAEVVAAAPKGRKALMPNLGHYALVEDASACAAALVALATGRCDI